jgi:hypothetical protein
VRDCATVATSSKLRDQDKICRVFPLLAERTGGARSKLSIFEGTHGLSGASGLSHESLTLAFCLATKRCMNLEPSFL